MFCNSTEEYSLLYLENELGSKEKKQLIKHIKTCGRCKLMFNIIKANYHAEEKVSISSSLPSEKINMLIDKSVYPVSQTAVKQFSIKRLLAVSLVFALLIFATANAKTIFKSYKDLMNSMFLDRDLVNMSDIVHTGTYSDEGYVKSIYEKHQSEIEAFISQLQKAEISSLKFDENGKSFKVQIAKGVGGDFISYGFEGYTIYHNDFYNNYSLSMFNNITKYASIDELLGDAGISPVPGYIPDGYNLEYCYKTASGKGRAIPESVGLIYRNDKDEYLNLSLTRSKMEISNVGIPDELKAAAGLFDSTSKSSSSKPDSTKNNFSSTEISEALNIGKYQAVYTEKNSNAKDGTYKKYGTISIFLGDNLKLPILRIECANVDKDTLIKMAENFEIANNTENLIKASDYFKGIKDEKILAYTDSYLDNIKDGKTEFKFKIDKETEFYKWSHNDVYYIMYRNAGIDKLKSVIPLQIKLSVDLIAKFKYNDVQILGWPYSEEKTYGIHLRNEDQALIGVTIESRKKHAGALEITDQIIAGMSGAQDTKMKPIFSNSGHLYYLLDLSNKSWILHTMYEENDLVNSYRFFIDKEIMADEKAVINFINTLK